MIIVLVDFSVRSVWHDRSKPQRYPSGALDILPGLIKKRAYS
jgi:hypothetical protein